MREAETRKLCRKAIDAWGIEAQLDMAIEECSELIKAIIKLRRGKGSALEVIEEAVDVANMMKQIEEIFAGCHLEWVQMRRRKWLYLASLLEQPIPPNPVGVAGDS